MTARERVLITGGTGVLGRELAARLRGRAEVMVLSRRPPRQPGFVRGDLETGGGLTAAVNAGAGLGEGGGDGGDAKHVRGDAERSRGGRQAHALPDADSLP